MTVKKALYNKGASGRAARIPPLCALLAALLFLLPGHARADATAVLSADRSEAFVTDEIVLKLSISGTTDVSDVSLPGASGAFSVQVVGPSKRFELINGSFSASVTYVWRLSPKRTGEFTIGPAQVTADGAQLRSNAVTVLVRQDPGSSAADDSGVHGPVFARARFLARKGYPGQELVFRLSIYHEAPLADKIELSLPDVPDLTFSPMGDSTDREVSIGGRVYGVTEASYAVVAGKAGTYRIPPIPLNVPVTGPPSPDDNPFGQMFPNMNFPGFSFRQTRMLETETAPLTLTVSDFPVKNRPADFGGLVGRFTISSELSPASLKAGEAATLTVTMKGRGNVSLLPDLDLPDLPGVKVYPDQPLFKKTPLSEGTRGEKTMKWVLVPQAAGTVSLPPFSLSFLDPETGLYRTEKTPAATLSVRPGDGRAGAAVIAGPPGATRTGREVSLLTRDIQTIHEDAGAIAAGRTPASLYAAALALPLLPLMISLLLRRVNRRSALQALNNRGRKAAHVFVSAVKRLPPEDFDGVLKAASAFLVARLGLEGGSPTPAEAEAMLAARGVPAETAALFRRQLTDLTAAVFSRAPEAFTAENRKELLNTVKKLDKAIRKP